MIYQQPLFLSSLHRYFNDRAIHFRESECNANSYMLKEMLPAYRSASREGGKTPLFCKFRDCSEVETSSNDLNKGLV